jgi:hypothetical protein
MSCNMMICYDIYDRFTMEHFPLRQNMILTISFFFLLATVSTIAAIESATLKIDTFDRNLKIFTL